MIEEGNMNLYGNVENVGSVGNGMKFGCGMNPMESHTGFNTRKRSREFCSFDPVVISFPNGEFVNRNEINNQKGILTFLADDVNVSMQIRQQELEIDRLVTEHTEKIRSEIESARWRITMTVIAAAEEGMKRLRSKEHEAVQIGRLNSVLEQKVKSLTEDNQIWQQMALTNEATANLLRRNLTQILTQIQQQQLQQHLHGGETAGAATVDDEQSCCGSNHETDHFDHHNNHQQVHHNNNQVHQVQNQQQRMLAKVDILSDHVDEYCRSGEDKNGSGLCRKCGKEEMCVLLLPCRHLCICTLCESSINLCPICKSTKNATLHVNMNSF